MLLQVKGLSIGLVVEFFTDGLGEIASARAHGFRLTFSFWVTVTIKPFARISRIRLVADARVDKLFEEAVLSRAVQLLSVDLESILAHFSLLRNSDHIAIAGAVRAGELDERKFVDARRRVGAEEDFVGAVVAQVDLHRHPVPDAHAVAFRKGLIRAEAPSTAIILGSVAELCLTGWAALHCAVAIVLRSLRALHRGRRGAWGRCCWRRGSGVGGVLRCCDSQ